MKAKRSWRSSKKGGKTRKRQAKAEVSEKEDKKKCIRDRRRSRRQEKIQRILEEFKGIKNISCVMSVKKRTLIPKIKNERGETITSTKGIANIFG